MANAYLDELRQRSVNNRALAESLISEMSTEQLGWRPAAKSWSPIEVLEHMNSAAEKYHVLIQKSIEQKRTAGLQDSGSFRPGWLQGWFVNMVEPKPNTRQLPAPGAFHPVAGEKVDTAIRDRFFELGNALQGLLDGAKGIPLDKGRFASPITPLLRFNIGEGLWLLVAHEHRHLLQIQRTSVHPQYPRT